MHIAICYKGLVYRRGDMESNVVVAKLSEVEAALLTIWQDALPVSSEEISIDKGFVDLGGDSISAMTCIGRIRAMYSMEFDILDFFMDESTISDFAKSIVAQSKHLASQ